MVEIQAGSTLGTSIETGEITDGSVTLAKLSPDVIALIFGGL